MFREQGVRVFDESPESPEQACELIRKYRRKADAVVLGGGDGTMHGAAPALLETNLPLGILPLGTANDLARSLMIPRELEDAISQIVSGESTRIYLAEVNGIPFFNVANIGLGADVNRKLSSHRKQRLGSMGYARTATRVLRHKRAFEYSLTLDGETLEGKSMQLAVGNGRFYGGGMTVHHEADLRKPEFTLYSISPVSMRKLAGMAPRFALGRLHRNKRTMTAKGHEITLATDSVKQVFADGERVAFTPADFRLVDQPLRVFSPIDRLRPLRNTG